MIAPATPVDEQARLADLRALDILDSEKEPAFERITSLAATLFDVPIAVVSLVDEARQWFKSIQGLAVAETSRDVSFCGHAILDEQPFIVPNAAEDERFNDNPLVTGAPHVRFYAGAPLTTPRGHRVGTLCLLDRRPRSLSPLQKQVLTDLASMVVSELELRATRRDKIREAAELQELLGAFPTAILVIGDDNVLRFTNAEATRMLGYEPAELVGKPYSLIMDPNDRHDSFGVTQVAHEKIHGPRAVHRQVVRKGGEKLTVEGTVGRLSWGGQSAVVVALRDVTLELREQEHRELVRSQVMGQLKLMLEAFDVLPNGIALLDEKYRCVYANRVLGDMLGLEPSEVIGWTPEDAALHVLSLTSQGGRASIVPENWRTMSQDNTAGQVFALVRPLPRVVRRTLHALDSPTHPHLSLWTDITHEAAEIARSEEAALTDSLTHLPNRRAAAATLTRALSGGTVSVVLFDIDHFKRVNDTHGHGAGDEVLKRVAAALKASAREGDLVARWGGEEFIGVLRGDIEGARRFAERARRAVSELKTDIGPVTISAGVAQGVAGSDPVKIADDKLYEAKRTGRNRVCS